MSTANFDPSGSAVGTGGLLADDSSAAQYANGQTDVLEATNSYALTTGFHAQTGSSVTVRIDENGGGSIMDGDYDVSNITYDANGNIVTLNRNKGSQNGANAMDELTYSYKTNAQDGPNQLVQVADAVASNADAEDIDGQAANNYQYNSIGQLIRNNSEDVDYVYNTSGLVTEVKKGGLPVVKFYYKDRNIRFRKETFNSNGESSYNTYYVHDINGQVLAVYNDILGSINVTEMPVYGIGRIGVAYTAANNTKNYVYELTDHLGNVRAVFQKNGANAQGNAFTDYYPFGMPMPGRNIIGDYRYSFQGQEKDAETNKEAFQLRLWDNRIGRWLTTDPFGEFSSPYLGMGNNLISLTDPDGGMTQDCCDDWKTDTYNELDGVEIFGVNKSKGHKGLVGLDFTISAPVLGQRTMAQSMAKAYFDVTGELEDGLNQRMYDAFSFLESPIDRTLQGTANSINSFDLLLNDFVASGGGNLYYFLGNRTIDGMSNMTLYDWSYTVGYSSPDIALSIGTGYGIPKLGSLRVPVYRRFGGGISTASGEYWSLVNPRIYGSTYRNLSGLPDWNTSAFQVRGTVELRHILHLKPAAPYHGNFGRLVPEVRAYPENVRLTHFNGFRIEN